MVLITGAAGQIGTALVRHLRSTGHDVLASDCEKAESEDAVCCDLRSDRDVADLFRQHRFSTVIHLAAVLATAFRADPLTGGDVNLSGTMRLLKASIASGVSRFVFGSSASVYGISVRSRCAEAAEPAPYDSYGASKLAIEKILELVPAAYSMETVSLRIARVLGPGAKRTGSPWRSQIFERPSPDCNRLTIPFAPDSKLSVVHVDDLVCMLQTLIEVRSLPNRVYNTPVELIRTDEIKRLAETTNGWQVSTGTSYAGPEIDGARFAQDFGFAIRSLDEHMPTRII
jgi:UDP-glucose 4-epimerase